jgi:GH15 family glucan-1,4-alpha-glucosidase
VTRIEDYGFIADTHSAALVSKSGSMDWLCLPRFDSPAIFSAILDGERGGRWRISPAGDITATHRRYRGDTLILETVFETNEGTVTLVDCLALEEHSDPSIAQGAKPEEVVVRLIRGESGRVPMEMEWTPRFGYGDVMPWFRDRDSAVEAVGGPDAFDLVATIPLERGPDGVRSRFEVAASESVAVFGAYHPSHIEVRWDPESECDSLIERTESFWRRWISRSSYSGPYRDHHVRSLLTLKGLTYSPTGGLVAAPTTSLPERIGGVRNWDYRYCWLRDSTFTLHVLLEEGFTAEAIAWRDWLLRAVAGDPQDLQIMYGVMGERRLYEHEIGWLGGYEESTPVRIGNAAHDQFQLDVYGEVIDSFHSARRAGIDTPPEAWELECDIVNYVCAHWREPDDGIWEVRSGSQHFVHSKVMAWVAVDRAIKAIEDHGKPGPLERWSSTRDAIRAEVMEKGVHSRWGCFKRSYDEEEPDASLLMLPLVGFVDAGDDVMVRTVEAIERDLMVNGFVTRYRTERAADGLPEGEGTFLMCSFWLVNCYVLQGRFEEARGLFDRLSGTCNDLGLLSEQYEADDDRLLGNFPQAFSHVALVTAARALETEGLSLRARAGLGSADRS